MFRKLILMTSCLLLGSCTTFVKITPEGDNVAVLTASDVSECTRVGDIVISVIDRMAGIDRPAGKVERDLNTLARNDAATRGGDTVVPVSDVYNGKRNYDIYRCRP